MIYIYIYISPLTYDMLIAKATPLGTPRWSGGGVASASAVRHGRRRGMPRDAAVAVGLKHFGEMEMGLIWGWYGIYMGFMMIYMGFMMIYGVYIGLMWDLWWFIGVNMDWYGFVMIYRGLHGFIWICDDLWGWYAVYGQFGKWNMGLRWDFMRFLWAFDWTMKESAWFWLVLCRPERGSRPARGFQFQQQSWV